MRYGLYKYVLYILAVLTLALSACSSSRLVEATRPAQPSSVNALTDSIRLEQLPPVPVPGVPTEPVTVTQYDSLDAPSADVQRVSYAPDGGLTLLLASGAQMTYRPPAYGESLDVIATSDSTTRAQVRGRPEAEEVDVIAPEPQTGFWGQVKNHIVELFAGIGALALIAFGLRYALK